MVKIGRACNQTGCDQTVNPVATKARNVHRRSSGKVPDTGRALCRTRRIRAPRNGLVTIPRDRPVTRRTGGRKCPFGFLPITTRTIKVNTKDCRNHPTGPLHPHPVPNPKVKCADLVVVVQCRT